VCPHRQTITYGKSAQDSVICGCSHVRGSQNRRHFVVSRALCQAKQTATRSCQEYPDIAMTEVFCRRNVSASVTIRHLNGILRRTHPLAVKILHKLRWPTATPDDFHRGSPTPNPTKKASRRPHRKPCQGSQALHRAAPQLLRHKGSNRRTS